MKVSKFMTTLLMAAVLAVTMVAACGASGQKEGKPGKKLSGMRAFPGRNEFTDSRPLGIIGI